MPRVVLRGLTWGHRRATGPLVPLTAAFTARHPEIDVDWVVRPLSDFEHQGIRELASIYDLIIYDHPFSGSIVETGAFEPLTEMTSAMVGLKDAGRYAGSSLASYRFGGSVWGLPIDAATQHAIYRADVLNRLTECVPERWADALKLGGRLSSKGVSLGLAVKSPHGILTIASLMANLGSPWQTNPDRPFDMDRNAFIEAYEQVRALLVFCPAEAFEWNAIDLHERMAAVDSIAYCPAVYGYGTYGEADYASRLSFAEFAGLRAPYHAGSTLGGTALAISRSSTNKDAARQFLAFSATAEAQRLMAQAHGQPAEVSVWDDAEIDARFNGFFSRTRQSLETAWIRPRTRGYIPFQAWGGEVVATGLRNGDAAATVWQRLEPGFAAVNT